MSISAFASAARHRRTLALPAVLCIAAAAFAHGGEPDPAPGPDDAVTAQDIVPPEPERGEPVGGDLIGREVLSANGETVGEVVDVAYSRRHDETAARIRLIGFLGTGEREISLPLSRLSLTPDGEVQTTLSSEQLESVPEVDQEFEPDENEL